MKLLGLEVKVHMMVKVKVTLLMPASPGPGPSGGSYYTFSIVGSTAGSCGDQEAGRPSQGTKPGLGLGFMPRPE